MAATFGATRLRCAGGGVADLRVLGAALIPLMIEASIAAGMHSLLFGSGRCSKCRPQVRGLSQLPYFALLGSLACDVLCGGQQGFVLMIEDGFRHLPGRQFWWPAIGGRLRLRRVARSAPAWATTDQAVLNDKLAVGTLLALLREARRVVDRTRVRYVGRHARADLADQRFVRSAGRASCAVIARCARLAGRVCVGCDGRDVRRGDPCDVHRDRVPLRADARLQLDTSVDARDGPGRAGRELLVARQHHDGEVDAARAARPVRLPATSAHHVGARS